MASTNHASTSSGQAQHEHESERYSARQDTKLKMGGAVGAAVYEGEVEAFAPLLALGEVLHVGKGTGMGLGRYEINSCKLLAHVAAGGNAGVDP